MGASENAIEKTIVIDDKDIHSLYSTMNDANFDYPQQSISNNNAPTYSSYSNAQAVSKSGWKSGWGKACIKIPVKIPNIVFELECEPVVNQFGYKVGEKCKIVLKITWKEIIIDLCGGAEK